MNVLDVIAAPMRCARCLTEFRPHEGGHCPRCGRPLCKAHGGATGGVDAVGVPCPACARAAHGAAVRRAPAPSA